MVGANRGSLVWSSSSEAGAATIALKLGAYPATVSWATSHISLSSKIRAVLALELRHAVFGLAA